MAHQLKMAIIQAIQQFHALGWSQRRIARELGIDRGTVQQHLARGQNASNPAIPPPGSACSKPATFWGVPARVEPSAGGEGLGEVAGVSNPAIPPPGFLDVSGDSQSEFSEPVPPGVQGSNPAGNRGSRSGRRSECEPYRELILAKLGQGLSAQRIRQDLVSERGFAAGYDSVKRFVRSLQGEHLLPMRRLECEPGYEAQVDFGTGARILTPEGKRRKTHVLRVVLSHSRKGYSEATYRQTTEDFLRCLENAFWHFGGVPRTIVIDNLKAAVQHCDWFDPELNPKLEAFCRHYGTVILPTKPRMPRHKGKVERGVGYVQDNGLKGRQFTSLEAENTHLLDWEANVADKRIHGTTRQQVAQRFQEAERPALLPLPAQRFEFFHEAQRKVSLDGHVEVAKAYYSAPPEYVRRTVWVRWDAHLVRIFNQRMEQFAVHTRQQPGKFSTLGEHIPREKINAVERGATYLLGQVKWIGPHTHQWAQAMLHARGIAGLRVLQGLLHLKDKHLASALEKACQTALSHGVFRLRTLRELMIRAEPAALPLPFLEEHPLIRPLEDYGRLVEAVLAREDAARAAPRSNGTMRLERHDWTAECAREQERPGELNRQGARDIHPPRSGYPLPGCSPAEPDSVSPDTSSVVRLDPSSPLFEESDSHV